MDMIQNISTRSEKFSHVQSDSKLLSLSSGSNGSDLGYFQLARNSLKTDFENAVGQEFHLRSFQQVPFTFRYYMPYEIGYQNFAQFLHEQHGL